MAAEPNITKPNNATPLQLHATEALDLRGTLFLILLPSPCQVTAMMPARDHGAYLPAKKLLASVNTTYYALKKTSESGAALNRASSTVPWIPQIP